jgi:hypothetical protein
MGTFEPFIEYALSVFVITYIAGILVALLSIWSITDKGSKTVDSTKLLVRYLLLPLGSWVIVFVICAYYALIYEKWKQ